MKDEVAVSNSSPGNFNATWTKWSNIYSVSNVFTYNFHYIGNWDFTSTFAWGGEATGSDPNQSTVWCWTDWAGDPYGGYTWPQNEIGVVDACNLQWGGADRAFLVYDNVTVGRYEIRYSDGPPPLWSSVDLIFSCPSVYNGSGNTGVKSGNLRGIDMPIYTSGDYYMYFLEALHRRIPGL